VVDRVTGRRLPPALRTIEVERALGLPSRLSGGRRFLHPSPNARMGQRSRENGSTRLAQHSCPYASGLGAGYEAAHKRGRRGAARAYSALEYQELDDGGHMFPLTHPEITNRLIATFLSNENLGVGFTHHLLPFDRAKPRSVTPQSGRGLVVH
jgi:pimeloyl-ACP methyl ester carboxylesterase